MTTTPETLPAASNIILNEHYAYTCPLREYLSLTVLDLDLDAEGLEGNVELRLLVDSLVVASQVPWDAHRKARATSPTRDIFDLYEDARFHIASSGGSSNRSALQQNVFTYGFRYSSGRVEPLSISSNVATMTSPAWRALHSLIGDQHMLNVLTQRSLFVSVGHGSLVQLTGKSIMEGSNNAVCNPRKRKSVPGRSENEGNPKRFRLDDKSTWLSASQVSIPRRTTFYRKPARRLNSTIILGFPRDHVLNASQAHLFTLSATQITSKVTTANGKKSEWQMGVEKAARTLSKNIFPRQYGFPSAFDQPLSRFPFQTSVKLPAKPRPDLPCKTPKRVKPVLPLMEQLLQRHRKYDYGASCGRICPSKMKTKSRAPLDTHDQTVILEMISEIPSQQPLSTLEVSRESEIRPKGAKQARSEGMVKPRFVEFSFGHRQVANYVIQAADFVIPKAFWGSRTNFKHIAAIIHRIVRLRRHEGISLHDAIQGFQSKPCTSWLSSAHAASSSHGQGVFEALKRRELLEDFLYWFLDSFVLSLIKTTFYVTESSAFRNHVLYFRQDDWEMLCRPLVNNMVTNQLTFRRVRMPEADIKRVQEQRSLSFGYIRLLPKETGIRPILNLKRKSNHSRSVNQLLQPTFQILNYEKAQRPHCLGASSSEHEEVYRRLLDFKRGLTISSPNRALPKLYFVKMDVRAAFDTIDQDKLLKILGHILQHESYRISRRQQIVPNAGKLKKTFRMSASAEVDWSDFQQQARELAERLKQAVFVDKVDTSFENKEKLLALLQEHITENIVKIGGSYYKQVVGIPQGSILSSLLCSFFYGDLEQTKMAHLQDENSLMLRWVDDYLYVTSDPDNALSFLDIMTKGHPEYGCFISKEKTLTNFWSEEHQPTMLSASARGMPWCGLLIGIKDLSVRADWLRYEGLHISNFMTISTSSHAGSTFEHKMALMAKQRTHPLFTDIELNSKPSVHLNIFHNMLLMAIRTHQYLKTWGIDISSHHRFIFGVIQRSLRYGALSTLSKLRNVTGKVPHSSQLSSPLIIWIGLYAFHYTLSRRPTSFKNLIKDLAMAMRSSQYRAIRKALGPFLKQHSHDLDFIQW